MIQRVRDQPVVEAGALEGFGAIFNAGLVHHDDKYHLFARAIRSGYRRNEGVGPKFLDYVSDVLVFESVDGVDYSFSYVLAKAGTLGVDCFEDPRVQLVTDHTGSHFIMTYTNLPEPLGDHPWRIGAHVLDYRGGRFHVLEESGILLGPDGMKNKDAVVFNLADGRVAMIHRLYPDIQIAVFDDLNHLWHADVEYWDNHVATLEQHVIIRPRPGALGVGAGAPLVATAAGLLMFFHERREDGVYTARVALLDATTGAVIGMLDDELLEPELPWECIGDVDNVVFVQGAHRRDDGTIYLVYGAADRHVGAAVVNEAALLARLLSPVAALV
jgi:beta-1,2-mannobiose phosphorylase / 1,2-beta-oligomannan phosphorylase